MKTHADTGDILKIRATPHNPESEAERLVSEHTTQDGHSEERQRGSSASSVAISKAESISTDHTAVSTEIGQFYPEEAVGNIPPFPHILKHPVWAASWIMRMLFGIVCLVLFLAVIAAIPFVNFIALGYLLDVEGRVARTGKIRLAFPLLDIAPRLGAIVIGTGLWLIPLVLLSGAAADAHLIDPGGSSDQTLHFLNRVLSILIAVHLCLALARGGTFFCYLRPFKNGLWLIKQLRSGGYWERAALNVSEFVSSLKLGQNFSLGLRGFLGAFLWLLVPSLMFASASAPDGGQGGPVFVTLLGGLSLVIVLGWLPLLQAHFAAENRLSAMFELRTIRRKFKRTPIAWMLALIVVYVLSLPLYLFKVAALPRDAVWGITLIFVATIYPTKILLGWVYHRASFKTRNARFGWRWLSRTMIVPLLALYVFLLFFTQFIGIHGNRVLLEHHVFLLPVPF